MTGRSTTRRRAILGVAVALPAVAGAAAVSSPAAGSIPAMLRRAALLVDQANAATSQAALEAAGEESVALCRAVAGMPCTTMADALAKMRAALDCDVAGDALTMVRGDGDPENTVAAHYFRDVARFLAERVAS